MTQDSIKKNFNGKQFTIWLGAIIIGCFLGSLGYPKLNEFFNFIARIYTRLFQFLAVPTIALALMTTLAQLGAKKNTGKIFLHTITYTLLTTLAASVVGACLYKIIAPENLPAEIISEGQNQIAQTGTSYYEHILSVIPNNIIAPIAENNVLSILIVSAAIGLAIAHLKNSENVQVLHKGIIGLQEMFFVLIKALVWALPLGIVAFSAQLAAQMSAGVIIGSLGKYVAVVLGSNLLQFFVILPIFLMLKGINPLRVFRCMLPAVLMALFTKSSAATLPVTVECAEDNLNAKPAVARFILPICCTINMNGCAAFILITSLFVMQNNGINLTLPQILLWVLIAVISAVGNAGVPMGCYFLTLSLMSGINVGILGIIAPIYAVIDMIETAVNVWSDSCVCAIVDKQLKREDVE